MPSLRMLPTSPDGQFSLLDVAGRRHASKPISARDLFGALPQDAPALSHVPWSNWLGDLGVMGFRVRPESRSEVIGAVQEALRRGVGIRAVGSGHSHSSAARPATGPENLWMDLSGYHGELPHQWLRRNVDPSTLVRLKAGTSIKHLNREILPEKGLALPNMGSFDGQTIAGAINTGTHGTGILLATLADMVRSVDFVTVVRSSTGRERVQAFRIEPTDGITDPNRFN